MSLGCLCLSICLVFLAFTVFTPVSARAPQRTTTITQLEDGATEWKECVNIPVLDETCIILDVFPNNLTIVLQVTVHNFTLINEQLTGTQICANQASLLQLLDLIPALLPFRPLIHALIVALKLIPAQVFSVCVVVEDLNVTSTHATGCVYLNTTLMCWEGKCLYKGSDDFGCFDIPTLDSQEATIIENGDDVKKKKIIKIK
eukprot:TRINITY_DN3501_c0_g1_i1.p1 TRINITY_DN3501_c0_g1~~TRINITY_DN3501_c0_g1_i1.p1  ORF type:complete len:222 (-),score=49.03 TRINITY_DN3501_c0_g1_i1:101-706(-)